VFGHHQRSNERKELVQLSSFLGFVDRDLESRDASSPDPKNAKFEMPF
jgi:hypothetical protein